VVLNIEYLDQSGQRSSRSVDPVGFYQGTDGWYLIGWCHVREAGRIFRLDRIQASNLTTKPAETHDVDRTLGWTPTELRTP
jgi:proteasome accessory factor B